MGNPAWGHGYHKGFGDGAKQGGIVGSLVTIGVGAVVSGGVWAIGKLRERGAVKAARVEGAAYGLEPTDDDPEASISQANEVARETGGDRSSL